MRNYRIAFFTADWNYELVESTLQGLKQYVDEHVNVRLCVFDCFGKDLDSDKDKSEYAIYDLADLEQFDGVLVQGNQIVLRRVRDLIAERIAQSGIPAVSIDCPLEGCTMIGIDNQSAQRDITDHVIRCHGARRLVYLTGLLDNGSLEGRQRLEGFYDACRNNGVPEENIQVIEGTWRTSDGATVIHNWMEEKRPLPDAFLCANDDMALGLMEALGEYGFRVPRDVIVTGFDGLSSAELSSPRLSTIRRDNSGQNYRAMDLLIKMIDGQRAGDKQSFPHQMICTESCGCGDSAGPAYLQDKYFHQTRFLKDFYSLQDEMAEDLFEADSLLELMDMVEDNKKILGSGNVYLCVNDYYFDGSDTKQYKQGMETFGKEMILAACGRDCVTLDRRAQYVRFPTRDLLPCGMMEVNRFLVFYPLHYNAHSLGYLVMDGISETAKLNLHMSIFSFLEIAMENVRKKNLLRSFNDILDDLYVHDALTGLYNRFGYERFAQQTFDTFLREDGGAQVLFIDMDHMKDINDRCGHETGDAAIKKTAEILRASCGPRDLMMRYGGDEFLVIASCRDGDLPGIIQRAVNAYNGGSEKPPFQLSLSVGVIRISAKEGKPLEECVREADELMYEQKILRKRCRK